MKKLYILALLIISITTFAQGQDFMSYQAVIRNSTDNLIVNQSIGIKISILQGSFTGAVVYSEKQTPTSNANGLITLEIGSGNSLTGNYSTIDWANGPYFIKTEIDPTGGISYTVTGISQLMSVPYALYAKASGSSIPGPMGPQGSAGLNGIDGATGQMGSQGPAGFNGADGKDGLDGATGPAGNDGLDGATGAMGPQGPAGLNGIDGAMGSMGMNGPQGPAGTNGLDGATGPMGMQGMRGLDGATGPVGPKGSTGNDGQDGANGPAGEMGAMGPAGSDASITLGAISTTPTANGASITDGELNLAPADVTNGGVVTTTDQTFAGNKTFSEGLRVENKPFLPTTLNQSQINSLVELEEGMVVYNTDTRKLQLYSVGASDAINDSFTGTFTDRDLFDFEQTFIPPTTGVITAIQLFVKSDMDPYADVFVDFRDGSGIGLGFAHNMINLANLGSAEWINLPVSNVAVTAGQTFKFRVMNMMHANFGTNSNYFNGSVNAMCCGLANGDDVMFKILITPTNGTTAYWLNLN